MATLVFILVYAVAMIAHYANPPTNNVVHVVMRKTVGVALAATLLGALTYLSMMVLWLLIAAILDPDRNLIQGVAMVTVVFVVYNVFHRLTALRRTLHDAITKELDDILATRLRDKWASLHPPSTADKLSKSVLDTTEKKDTDITIGAVVPAVLLADCGRTPSHACTWVAEGVEARW